jgi:hypothetical protein
VRLQKTNRVNVAQTADSGTLAAVEKSEGDVAQELID